ncbi:hypothetical protein HanRHA438_Chr13g0584081 [Helianthus annuus]|nr:hypothetical protein HanRHA438_Chr13g0584081 [Helianthus annuus]
MGITPSDQVSVLDGVHVGIRTPAIFSGNDPFLSRLQTNHQVYSPFRYGFHRIKQKFKKMGGKT